MYHYASKYLNPENILRMYKGTFLFCSTYVKYSRQLAIEQMLFWRPGLIQVLKLMLIILYFDFSSKK